MSTDTDTTPRLTIAPGGSYTLAELRAGIDALTAREETP